MGSEPLSDMTGFAAADSMTAMLEQAIAGDEVAFARIVAAHHADMIRVAYGICREPDLAKDAVQAAWLTAWCKLRTVRQPDRLRSWLVAVAANEARHLGPPSWSAAARRAGSGTARYPLARLGGRDPGASTLRAPSGRLGASVLIGDGRPGGEEEPDRAGKQRSDRREQEERPDLAESPVTLEDGRCQRTRGVD